MSSATTQVQQMVRTIPVGELFTARDIAQRLNINPGFVGKVLSKGIKGTVFHGRREIHYRWTNQSGYRYVQVYRRVAIE